MENTCKHERKLSLQAKCSDMCSVSFPDGTRQDDGYAPRDLGIGGGDYIVIDICVDCAKVIGFPAVDVVMAVAAEMKEEQEFLAERRKLR